MQTITLSNMKKKTVLIFLLAFGVANISLAKSKINIDKTRGDIRMVETERTAHVFRYNKRATDCSISLTCVKDLSTQESSWNINVFIWESDVSIAAGDKLLLKLENGEIITLSANSNCSSELYYTRTNMFGATLYKQYVVVPSYTISRDLLGKVMTSNVVKVRLETTMAQFDGKVYDSKFSETIVNDYILIRKTLSQDKSIYDDF